MWISGEEEGGDYVDIWQDWDFAFSLFPSCHSLLKKRQERITCRS